MIIFNAMRENSLFQMMPLFGIMFAFSFSSSYSQDIDLLSKLEADKGRPGITMLLLTNSRKTLAIEMRADGIISIINQGEEPSKPAKVAYVKLVERVDEKIKKLVDLSVTNSDQGNWSIVIVTDRSCTANTKRLAPNAVAEFKEQLKKSSEGATKEYRDLLELVLKEIERGGPD